MNEQQKGSECMNEFISYLNLAIEKAEKKEQELIATERKDEANLQKIKANIYGVCRTVFGVVSKTSTGEALKVDYVKRLDNISRTWVESYERAKQHNDVEKILVEEIKLDVIKKVKECLATKLQ